MLRYAAGCNGMYEGYIVIIMNDCITLFTDFHPKLD